MSKASDFKEKIASLECQKSSIPIPAFTGSGPIGLSLAEVSLNGDLKMNYEIVNSKEALGLANWIIDTFSDNRNCADA